MIRRAGLALALGVLVAASGCASGSGTSSPLAEIVTPAQGDLRGAVLQPATPEPSTTLMDTAGQPWNLRSESRGKVALVYFGYTHCPDICPTIMADIAQALRESSSAVRSHVEVAFISVDPQRDSRTVIRRWLANFDRSFVGLRGSIRRVIAAQHAMGVPVSKVNPHAKHGYSVQHSAEVLAFTPDRKAHVAYLDGPSTISDLRHDLAILTTDPAYA